MTVQDELNHAQLQYLQLLLDAGCKLRFKTNLFGHSYVWMQSPTGTVFLERIPDES